MIPLTRKLSFQISTVDDIVRQGYRNCNSVTSLHLPSSPSSSFSSSAATLLRGRPLLYIRPRTPAAAAQRNQQRSMAAADDRIAGIASAIRVIPDFPKPGTQPGILFQDITTLLLDPKAFKETIDLFVERYKDKGISVLAGVEARGFIFGPPIALAIGAKLVPMRKPNKLADIDKCKDPNLND